MPFWAKSAPLDALSYEGLGLAPGNLEEKTEIPKSEPSRSNTVAQLIAPHY
jgi:hypothetical protein